MHTLPISKDTIKLDSLTIVPGSVLMLDKNGARIDSSNYVINDEKGTLIWKKQPAGDSAKVIYRTFPFDIHKVYFSKDINKIQHTEDFIVNPFTYSPADVKRGQVIDFGALDYNGSFARGISFGNSQDAVVNSSFNLQLSGHLTQDIEVEAAITDNNIPIQPDGNTQQLQQFDKVYIQITKKPHKLIVGDFEIGNPPGYFTRFYKNLQGIGYRSTVPFKDSSKLSSSLSLAIAKGKFAKNSLAATEGNQGPYRLTGANGETFIIILAGTEKVYVNGELKRRGADKDYVIDYNLGEVTFTPNMLITSDLRVSVEFQYSDKNYFRSFVFANVGYERKKVKFNVNFYSEQDSKNQPVQIDLNADQKRFLSTIGNDLTRAIYPGYTTGAYDANRIQYKLVRDTIVNGITYDSVFVFASTANDTPVYNLNFAYVGPNQGNYQPSITTANGRVFQWVEPLNGTRQGAYQPIIVLVTPKRQQLTTVGMEYTPTKNDWLKVEAALSNSDNNLFSTIGNNQNIGTAEKVYYKRNFLFGGKDTVAVKKDSIGKVATIDSSRMPMMITTEGDYEFRSNTFKPIERYRPVEFSRNWNYNELAGDSFNQHLALASITFNKPGWARETYTFNTLIVQGYYKGYMHMLSGSIYHKRYKLEHTISFLTTDETLQRSQYFRPTVLAEKSFAKLKGWRIGGVFLHENNRIRSATSDTLQTNSFVFTDWRVYIASADTSKNKARFEYVRRQEYKVDTTRHLYRVNTSNTLNVNGEWSTYKYMGLRWQLTYRRFYNKDSAAYNNNKPEDYFLGRLEYNLNVLKGAISTNILYELGAGREQRRDYTYLPVSAGLGNYVWHDYNHNGRKEGNEFELSSYTEDTMYVRVINPTNEYDPVNTTQYNQVLNLNPRAILINKHGFADFVSRISTTTSLQVNRKVYRNAHESPFNPFVFDTKDTALLTINSIIRNSVFFNRASTVYSLEYTITDNRGKTNLTNGFETRLQREHLGRVRWNIIKSINVTLKGIYGFRSNSSVAFQDRNYYIKYFSGEPEFTWLFKNKFRITLSYGYFNNHNTIATGNNEKAINHQATFDARYSIVSSTSVNAHFSFTNVSYNGATDNALEFAMLQGLKNGKNYIWSTSVERTIGKNIQVSVTYEGRKTGIANMVHTGRAQVRALF